MDKFSISSAFFTTLLFSFFSFLFLVSPNPAKALDATNPGDYTGPGDWNGTSGNDHYTNTAGETVDGSINMTQGGNDTVDNAGLIKWSILGSKNGGNTFNNSGTVSEKILGSNNDGYNNYGGSNNITNTGEASFVFGGSNSNFFSSGGSNTINNSGTVWSIIGNNNSGELSSGGLNTITNSGDVIVYGEIYGSWNSGLGSSGGSNTINNSGVANLIIGSENIGEWSSGGSNIITNSGDKLYGDIFGSINKGDNSYGGENTIINTGTIHFSIVGSWNSGLRSVGWYNTITNSGTVHGTIFGSGNDGINSYGGENTITNSGTVDGDIFGSYSNGLDSSGEANTITNSGTVLGDIFGSYTDHNGDAFITGKNNTIINSGTVYGGILGSYNNFIGLSPWARNWFGGINAVTNSGTVYKDLGGSWNAGIYTSGGYNTMSNSGTVYGDIFGSYNVGIDSSGGLNTISNSGMVYGDIYGSLNAGTNSFSISNTIWWNYGINSSSLGNTIFNSGTVKGDIWGSKNEGAGSSGGNDTIINSGTVDGDIYGSWNGGTNSSSLGNTIINSGTVKGDIWGSWNGGFDSFGGDDSITNYGTVLGSIFGADGNDLVILVGGSYLGGVADGGTGIDTLGFNNMGTQDGSLQGTKYLNFENLSILGGSTTLTGLWDFSTGYVVIHNGNLYVNGTLITNLLTIYQNGLLGGTGVINSNIINYGTISPGNSIGTLTVKGNVTFMEGSIYLVEIQGDRSDLLDVSGAVTINGGTVKTKIPVGLYTNGKSWTIITTDGGINGRFSSLSTGLNSVTLKPYLSYGSNTVRILIKRIPFETLGVTDNQSSIGAVLDTIVPKAQGGMRSQIITMDFGMNAGQIQETLNAMSPEIYSTFGGAGLESSAVLERTISFYQSERRLHIKLGVAVNTGGEEPVQQKGWNVWARMLGSSSQRDGEGSFVGYSREMSAVMSGIDKIFNNKLTLGLTLAHSDSDIEWSESSHDGSVTGTHIGLYTSGDFGNLFVDATVSFSDFDNSSFRDISFEGTSAAAVSDFDSIGLRGKIRTGYDVLLGGWFVSPVVGLGYAYLERDGFTEQGAAHLNLDIYEDKAKSLTTSLGIQCGGLFELGQWQLLPKVSLSWVYEFEDDAPSVSANFVDYSSSDFTVNGIAPASDYGLFDMSVSAKYGANLSLFFDYSLAVTDGFDSHLLTGGLAWWF